MTSNENQSNPMKINAIQWASWHLGRVVWWIISKYLRLDAVLHESAELGDFDQAERCFRRAELRGSVPARAWCMLARARAQQRKAQLSDVDPRGRQGARSHPAEILAALGAKLSALRGAAGHAAVHALAPLVPASSADGEENAAHGYTGIFPCGRGFYIVKVGWRGFYIRKCDCRHGLANPGCHQATGSRYMRSTIGVCGASSSISILGLSRWRPAGPR